MTRALTYVEIDVPQWTQQSPDSPETEFTLRFAVSTDYLPNSIPAIPSITDIQIEPTTISLGENLGQRAVVTVTFRDHRHVFDGEDFSSGTFWGKFRARYGLFSLQGNPFRLIRGTLGQELEDMETRHYQIDGTEGPNSDGEYKIIAKDIFALAMGDKAQAPLLSNGYLGVAVPAGALAMVLLPTGVGAEYPSSGYASIGGTEIVGFTSTGGDTYSITRGEFNTLAIAHDASERVQLALFYDTYDPADIIYDLLTAYVGIDPDFVPLPDWQAETSAYLNGLTYTALIADPRPVDKLLSEIIEQASLALWWDDLNQSIRLQVLQPIPITLGTYDQNITMAGTLEITEQPEKRLSEVQVYFSKINPLVQEDEVNNYARTQRTADDEAVVEYGSATLRRILSRWIPSNGATTAATLSNKLLGRYRDPPRRVAFHLPRDQLVDPQLGGGYELGGTPFQDITGAAATIPIQITRLKPLPDHFEVEAEEMLWTPFGSDIDPTVRTVTISSNTNNANLRTLHDALYGTPASGDTVNCIIQLYVIVGSSSVALPAFDVGTWPGGVTVTLTVNGRIQGHGGSGGTAGGGSIGAITMGGAGGAGGTALYTRQAISLTSTSGAIWSGGGGGGGGGAYDDSASAAFGGDGGGGGAGTLPGAGGQQGFGLNGANGVPGENGTSESGGGTGSSTSRSAPGGNPGSAGQTGDTPAGIGGAVTAGGAGGAAGAAIDGDSFVTDVGAPGSILGTQIN